jgi:hypothetical protein
VGKIVILEGPDGGGKTALAQRFQRAGFAYHHEGPPPKRKSWDALAHYGALVERARRARHDTVFDRLHLGETIYGPLARGWDRLGIDGLKLMNRLIRAAGVKIWLCLPSYTRCLENWRTIKGGRAEYVKDELIFRRIYDAWRRRYARLLSIFDYTIDDEGDLIDDALRERPQLPPGVVGAPNATWLFVGERPAGPLDLAFFAREGSSAYLNRCLARAGFREPMIALVNACSWRGGQRRLRRLQEQYSLRVVALGAVARSVCLWQGVPVRAALPHPQYWKRFHFHDEDGYVQLLRRIK